MSTPIDIVALQPKLETMEDYDPQPQRQIPNESINTNKNNNNNNNNNNGMVSYLSRSFFGFLLIPFLFTFKLYRPSAAKSEWKISSSPSCIITRPSYIIARPSYKRERNTCSACGEYYYNSVFSIIYSLLLAYPLEYAIF